MRRFFWVMRIPIRISHNQRIGIRCTHVKHPNSFFITFETEKIKIIMKKLLTIAFIIIFITSVKSQSIDSTALILIDIQNFYFPGGAAALVEPEKAAEQAKVLLNFFRENNGLVVHVKHDFSPGGEIHELVKPLESEKVFTKKEVNAFLNSGLNDYLKQNNIKYVTLCGMQTQMCLEGGTRAAHDLGYECTVVEDACATRDLKFGDITVKAEDVHYSTLATLKSYGKVLNLKEFLESQNKK
jgi:nicotinamidase-related amidase